MFLSKSPSGVYYLWFKDECGNRQKVSTRCRLKADAFRFLQDFKQSEPRIKTYIKLTQFKQELISHIEVLYTRDTVKIYRQAFDSLVGILGDVPLLSINKRDVDIYKSERLKKVKPITVNTRLIALKSAFNYAIRWKYLKENPFTCVRFCSVPQQAPIFFAREDFQKLINIIKESWLKEVVIFATLTGMRLSEITNLRWRDVDLRRKLIAVQSSATFKTKHGKRRDIPLNGTVMYLLQQKVQMDALKRLDDYVFTLNGKKILNTWLSHKFKYYVYECRFQEDRLHFHSLRHTFASWMVQDGVSIYAIKELLGHADVKTGQIYSHLAGSELHGVVDRISISLN
ncbi:MAG: site-specific integrase [Bacteroidota bacterium]